jgi:myo-inositol-1(or 4)-monophosphatase
VIVDGDGRPDPLPGEAMIVAVPGAVDAVLGWWRATEG